MARDRNQRLWEFLLIALAATNVLVMAYTAAKASQGKPAGCANNTCKNIQFRYWCPAGTGTAYETPDCDFCRSTFGRCKDGVDVSCVPGDTPLNSAGCTVTPVCDCANLPPGDARNNVEATGDLPGTFKPVGRNAKGCGII
jgi:hypothetical protein